MAIAGANAGDAYRHAIAHLEKPGFLAFGYSDPLLPVIKTNS